MNRLDLCSYILLGCPIVLSSLYSLEKPYDCAWGRTRTPIRDCSLVENCGHVRDMVDF